MEYGFGAGSIWVVQQNYQDGSTPTTPTISKLAVLQEWSMDIQWDSKQLYGGYDSALVVARGKAKYPLKFKLGSFNAQAIETIMFGNSGQPVTGETVMADDESHSVPDNPGPYTVIITPPNSGTYVDDWGVRYAVGGPAGGPLLTKASAAAPGVYSESGGTYTFDASDKKKGVLISFEYTVTPGHTISVSRQLLGSLPVFRFMGKILGGGNQYTVKMNNVVATKFSTATKLDDFAYPEIEAEAFADTNGVVMQISMVEN